MLVLLGLPYRVTLCTQTPMHASLSLLSSSFCVVLHGADDPERSESDAEEWPAPDQQGIQAAMACNEAAQRRFCARDISECFLASYIYLSPDSSSPSKIANNLGPPFPS